MSERERNRRKWEKVWSWEVCRSTVTITTI